MSKVEARPPALIVDSINTKARNVRDAANALSKRIEQFEEYLGNLPGRVDTYCYGTHPDAEHPEERGFISLVLWLHRQGKSWALSYGTYDERWNDRENPVDFKPLNDASLKMKLAAIKMFPNMLSEIEKSQDKLVTEIQEASAEFDKFIGSLKVPEKEGK